MPTRRLVLDMKDHRPVWAMPSWVPERLKEALPADWEAYIVQESTDGSGDGAVRVSPAVLDAVRDAEIYCGYGVPPELLRAGPGLRWVHTGAAGVGGSLHSEMRASDVIFTNSAGVHAPPMAETVLAMILHFARGIDHAVVSQAEGCWSPDRYYRTSRPPVELSRSTVGIVGFGGIGREIARRVASLGARVIAAKRTVAVEGEADLLPVYGSEGLGTRIELVQGPKGLDVVLRESDFVVLAAPDTPETRGLIDATALGRMRDGSVLINVARGRLVVEDALIEALASGKLRGAALDVFECEPLPEGHRLWSAPSVLLTPHVSAVTRGFWARELDLIIRNLTRYLSDVPLGEWENVVDKEAGY